MVMEVVILVRYWSQGINYNAPNMFSIRIHHGGIFHKYPGRRYVDGYVDIFDMVDIDMFTVIAVNRMVLQLGYQDVRLLATLVRSFKLVEVYIEHGFTVVNSYQRPPPHVRATIEVHLLRVLFATMLHLGLCLNTILVHLVIKDVMRQLSFEETELDGEVGFDDVVGSGIDISGLSRNESFIVDDLDYT
uniref:PB1-like domain-containing protein n=1 Tax=Tanacetum cinerariifolium TaxID=118510 RepID=A0A6L2JQH1_TANCI|nr:hypothetical protein [Tanacetum cinerariifolium]